ncbi:putative enzyme related to lactoylglutathione lyase [Streptacidiphilus sp. MAP12-20]|uniref:VOC family protein n=1 Tax=Streptacidiphilus sp. MAP12-20 TaxID=3156299 RepID=UPI003514F2E2
MTPTGHHPAPAWFDISTPDAARSRRFYQEMFGWPVNVLDETYALVGDTDGRPTGGIGQSGPDSPFTGIVVYFRVDDVDSTLVRAEALGGTRVMEPTETPVSRIAVFADPDGNLIGLLSR